MERSVFRTRLAKATKDVPALPGAEVPGVSRRLRASDLSLIAGGCILLGGYGCDIVASW